MARLVREGPPSAAIWRAIIPTDDVWLVVMVEDLEYVARFCERF